MQNRTPSVLTALSQGTFVSEDVYEAEVIPSVFALEKLQYYSAHPNLAQFYEPWKPTALHKFLHRNKRIRSFVLKVVEYDQDKTELIMTNNPPPRPFSPQGKDTAPKYFSEDWLTKVIQQQCKPTERTDLSLMSWEQKVRPQLKPVFVMTMVDSPESKKEQWFRFSTDNDFKSKGNYSKTCALRKQKTMYPQLNFSPNCKRDPEKEASSKSESAGSAPEAIWEPLTLLSLLEEKPTRTVPGETTFRHGSAQQWIVKNATVTK
ncbi:PREDICTED: testis-specific gene 13 protein [Elephantulus edwardii]|uniref:testis-specific gene 13 protein n=1 Tax=Elephantulus edwardii TaxID=28737 RepID=UPI0003F0A058|nr:PREDICTED: testis-specific gene 13 protein [Elephantulus edwardii]